MSSPRINVDIVSGFELYKAIAGECVGEGKILSRAASKAQAVGVGHGSGPAND